MKTALEWSKYLPQAIKQWFIIEATNQKYKKKTKFNYLVGALDEAINFEESELGYDFWYGIYILAKDYKGREAEILTDLEWIDELKVSDGQVAPKWGELVEAPKEKKSSTNSSVINTLKAENEALLQSNTEFKKHHKTLLKANQESMERQVELGTANSNLLSENETLKFTVEAGQEEIHRLYNIIYEQSDQIKEQKVDIFHLEETIRLQEETIKTLTQMVIPAPKKQQSIFFDLLEHLNIIKK